MRMRTDACCVRVGQAVSSLVIVDLEALRSFYHVARERSFSRAAKLLHISQPAMSVRVKSLEKVLGERLFDRERKGVALTEAGAVLFESAEKIFADVEEAHARLREIKDSGSGRVRLGCSDTVSLYLLPPILKKFRRRFEAAEITIRNAYTSEICDLLVRGELDFGIVTRPTSLDRRLEASPLFVTSASSGGAATSSGAGGGSGGFGTSSIPRSSISKTSIPAGRPAMPP